MAVDGRGMFLTCKYAIEAMTAQPRPGGALVCVSSISGWPGRPARPLTDPRSSWRRG